jgi:hypothetical protein
MPNAERRVMEAGKYDLEERIAVLARSKRSTLNVQLSSGHGKV